MLLQQHNSRSQVVFALGLAVPVSLIHISVTSGINKIKTISKKTSILCRKLNKNGFKNARHLQAALKIRGFYFVKRFNGLRNYTDCILCLGILQN